MRGLPEPVEGPETIAQDMLLALMTVRGERVMRPDFGSSITDFTFELANETLPGLICAEINSVIGRFEPRVLISRIDVQLGDDKQQFEPDSHVLVRIDFVIRATRQEQTLTLKIPGVTSQG
jgi:hypothetical protein